MPQAFPEEFRDDVVAIAMKRESSFAQIAKDFGISELCVQRWVKVAEVDGGRRCGVSSSEAAVTCRVLKFAKQPYYRWLQDPVSQRD